MIFDFGDLWRNALQRRWWGGFAGEWLVQDFGERIKANSTNQLECGPSAARGLAPREWVDRHNDIWGAVHPVATAHKVRELGYAR